MITGFSAPEAFIEGSKIVARDGVLSGPALQRGRGSRLCDPAEISIAGRSA